MMMTTIPSPHLMRTDTKREKNKEDPNAYRILCSIAHRRRRLTFAQKGGKKRPLERGVQTKKLSNWIEFHVPRLYLVHRLRRTRRLITSRGVICIRVHLLHHSRLRAGACGGRATTTFVAHHLFWRQLSPFLGFFSFFLSKLRGGDKKLSLSPLF